LEIFPKALRFKPRLIIVAFYTGNDPVEGYKLAYANERWADLRPDPDLGPSDMPKITFPPPDSERWEVTFKDGLKTNFSPKMRRASNQENPVVRASYSIIAEAARRMSEMARSAQVELIFTIVPTKEFVYAKKVAADDLDVPADYLALIDEEGRRIEELSSAFKAIDATGYVDIVGPLQLAARDNKAIYPASTNGHPIKPGYAVIAKAIAQEATRKLPIRKTERKAVRHQFDLALELQKAGLRRESNRIYDRILAIDPMHENASFNLAYSLVQNQSELQRAVTLLKPLVRSRPEALFHLGRAHARLGQTGKAAEAFNRYLAGQVNPGLAGRARAWLTEHDSLAAGETR
jgi:tetratricopeptide (TPR) repeat protein